MSAEQETVALKEYLESLIRAQRDFFTEKMSANAVAVDLARQEYRREVEHLNALRESVEEDRKSFVTQETYQQRHENLRTEIENIKLEQARSEARIRAWLAAITLFLSSIIVISHFIK